MRSLLTFRDLFARQGRGLVATLLLSLVSTMAGVALLGISGWFLTGAALTTAALSFNLFGPSALVRGLSFLRIGSRYGEKLIGHDVTLRLLADIRGWLFGRLVPRVPLGGPRWRRGDLVSRLLGDVEALDTMFITALGPTLIVVLVGLGVEAALFALLPSATAVFGIGFGLAVAGLPMLLVATTRHTGRRLVVASAGLRSSVLDGVEGHADLLCFAATGAIQADVEQAAGTLARIGHRQSRAGAGASAAASVCAGLT
ncbi:thiol reductant ABC exporter subunit CydC, partial [Lichenihabitans sp. Uapishka_5]|nr:thiol reductant ABC exporter subunit CydC [Lichenihabitans sp. Uapishka_5]